MPQFRRARFEGGTFFFTLVTNHRQPIFDDRSAMSLLKSAFRTVQSSHPFQIPAAVVLRDHLHVLMTLPEGDDDYSSRIGRIKVAFTKSLSTDARAQMPTTHSRFRHREAGVWQRRFWEHMIRDEEDFNRHVEYIHYNPVRHGVATCPHAWPWSSFRLWVKRGVYAYDWACGCTKVAEVPTFVGAFAAKYEE